jgi:hypothetical protein
MPNSAAIRAHLQTLASYPGIDGCALVESATGMAWHFAGSSPEIERISEAAIEFWRIKDRLAAQLTTLGALQSAAYSFSNRVVALFPCSEDPGLVLVCIAAKGEIAWGPWGLQVEVMRRLLVKPNVELTGL